MELPSRQWSVAEFCVDGVCADQGLDLGRLVMVGDEPSDYAYHLVVVDPGGRELTFDGVLSTSEYRVNGPGCAPVTANALVVVGDGGTVAIEPWSSDRP